jgi:hypothetical protein
MELWEVVATWEGDGGAGEAKAWTSLSSGAWVSLGLPLYLKLTWLKVSSGRTQVRCDSEIVVDLPLLRVPGISLRREKCSQNQSRHQTRKDFVV